MPRKKILIADDSATVVDILKHILEDQFQIITAKDGIEAIEKVYQENPDLVILDILMPKMNGYQVCRLLKADPPTAELPVLILSIKDQKEFDALKKQAEFTVLDLEKDLVRKKLLFMKVFMEKQLKLFDIKPKKK